MTEAQLTEGIYQNIVRWHKTEHNGHVTLFVEDEDGKKYQTDAPMIVDWIGNDIDRLTRFDLVVFNVTGGISCMIENPIFRPEYAGQLVTEPAPRVPALAGAGGFLSMVIDPSGELRREQDSEDAARDAIEEMLQVQRGLVVYFFSHSSSRHGLEKKKIILLRLQA